MLSAASSRTGSDCGTTIYASDRWEYDQLPQGSVSAGLVTSHTVERRTESGALIGSIRQFDTSYDASYDASGNPVSATTTRDDGATRAVSVAYDPFGLAIVSLTTTATGVPATQVSITRDTVTLMALSTTDPNGTRRGATFDGFDRPVVSTVTHPGRHGGRPRDLELFRLHRQQDPAAPDRTEGLHRRGRGEHGAGPGPHGATYSNAAGQTVNPFTGQTIPRSDPWWHIGLDWMPK